jgi:hypothetical protein
MHVKSGWMSRLVVFPVAALYYGSAVFPSGKIPDETPDILVDLEKKVKAKAEVIRWLIERRRYDFLERKRRPTRFSECWYTTISTLDS